MLNLYRIFSGFPGAVQRLASNLGLVAPSFVAVEAALVDGATIAIDAAAAGSFTFTALSNAAREFQVPTGGIEGQRLFLILVNDSGGALTLTTFIAAIRRGTLTLPADNFQRQYELAFSGGTWAIVNQSATDIPN